MSKGMFGGNTSLAHFCVTLPFAKPAEREEKRKKVQVLKDAGIKQTIYFHYRVSDEAAKRTAKSRAEAEAARIETLTGVKMSVYEGAFL